jgi:hypothetical protein
MFTRTDVWEYVLHGRQEYGFCSRTYRRMSCTIGVRTVLQSLVVAPIHNPEYEGNGCLERPAGIPSVCVRFTLQG